MNVVLQYSSTPLGHSVRPPTKQVLTGFRALDLNVMFELHTGSRSKSPLW